MLEKMVEHLDLGQKFAARVVGLKYQTVMRVNDPAHFTAKQEEAGGTD
jgi:hypothetical protein